MSFFDGIFGTEAQASILGSSDQINNAFDQAYQNYQGQANIANQSQIQAQYSRAQQSRWVSHNWVFNGRPCTLHEFADAIWGKEDHEDKMLFILTHSGPKK